jgi:hypothetical protein
MVVELDRTGDINAPDQPDNPSVPKPQKVQTTPPVFLNTPIVLMRGSSSKRPEAKAI